MNSSNADLTRRSQPSKGCFALRIKDFWAVCELLFFLALRNITVRYKQTVLNFSWAIIQPFVPMVVVNVFFGGFARFSSDGLPYLLFASVAETLQLLSNHVENTYVVLSRLI